MTFKLKMEKDVMIVFSSLFYMISNESKGSQQLTLPVISAPPAVSQF